MRLRINPKNKLAVIIEIDGVNQGTLPRRVLPPRFPEGFAGEADKEETGELLELLRARAFNLLLDWLANELLTANYDVRHIIRLIVTSEAYQREAGVENLASAGPEERFFHAPARRRLTAEQIVDSLHAAAGAVIDSEPMTFVHDGSKTLQPPRTSGFM